MRVGIIGGGASGTYCAIQLAQRGIDVTVYERNPQIGKKILVTGNGRCNFTNDYLSIDNYHGLDPLFAQNVINQVTGQEIISAFEAMGVYSTALESGRRYPVTFDAKTVRQALENTLTALNVKVLLNTKISRITKDKTFKLESQNGDCFYHDVIVLACGGKTLKSSGSDGSGYTLARDFGLEISPCLPAIVQLKTDKTYPKRLDGVRLKAQVRAFSKGNMIAESTEDVLLTSYGLTGTAILNVSVSVMEHLDQGVDLRINWVPFLSKKELFNSLESKCAQMPGLSSTSLLTGIVPEKAAGYFSERFGLKPQRMGDIREGDLKSLVDGMRAESFKVISEKPKAEGQVTLGGVCTSQMDPQSLMVNQFPGLYIIGELLDVTGDCGGYNLHWAWASAAFCANHILEVS